MVGIFLDWNPCKNSRLTRCGYQRTPRRLNSQLSGLVSICCDLDRSFANQACGVLPISNAIVLPLESSQRGIPSIVLSNNESTEVLSTQASPGSCSFLENSNDGLLESNCLRLECIFCNHWEFGQSRTMATPEEKSQTVTLCISWSQTLKMVVVGPLDHRL